MTLAGSRRHLDPSARKGGAEKRRLLEAIAAAPVGHHLLLHGVEIEPDRAAEQDIDIFEWMAFMCAARKPLRLARSGFVRPE